MARIVTQFGLYKIAVWSLMITVILSGTLYMHHQNSINNALQEARTCFKLNLHYRSWGANIGGVYAPVEKIPPNPYLVDPKRDITTTDNQTLTLVNPAYMSRMVFELVKADTHMPVISRLTSLKPLNPANAPDDWEREALLAFEQQGSRERSQLTSIAGSPYLRLLARFDIEKGCLKCHQHQGYKEGDIRGGISISIPLAPYIQSEAQTRKTILGGYLLLWVTGSSVLAASSRKRYEQQTELLRSEEKFRTVCDWTHDWEYWQAADGTLLYTSPSCLRFTGYTTEEIYAQPALIETLVHPDDVKLWQDHSHAGPASAPDMVAEIEVRFMRRDGSVCWVSHLCRAVYSADGSYCGLRVSNHDINGRKQAEEVLRQQEEELTTIFENTPYIMMLLDKDLRIHRVNSLARSVIGKENTDIIGVPSGEALHCINSANSPSGCGSGQHCQHCSIRQAVMQTYESGCGNHQLEVQIPFLAGQSPELRTFLLSSTRIFVKQQPLVLLGLEDVSSHKRLEAQMHQVQKMDSIGVLAGGLAHDFNNILTAIIGYGDLSLTTMEADDPQRPNVEQMVAAAHRAAHLTRDLLLFSRKQSCDKRHIDLNDVVGSMQHLMQRVIGEDISCTTALPDESSIVLADTHQIEQILMNLATNARDAMPHGGTFSISVQPVQLDEAFVSTHGFGTTGPYILLAASDNGTGMDEKTRQHIFDPFFTTKEIGKGTGLGLAVAYGIIKEHDGFINVYSEPGIGTTFRIYLPAVTSGGITADQHQTPESASGGRETILLAEDDEFVRSMTASILREYGYRVIVAMNGSEVVNMFKEHRDSVQLLLLDLIMPFKSGKEAYDEIRLENPQIPVIFSSGYAPEIISRKGLAGENLPLLTKPFTTQELLKIVRTTLDRIA